MKCPMCGKGKLLKNVRTLTAELDGGGELVLENIPCIECDKCGQYFFSEPTVTKLAEIRKFYRKFSGQKFMVDFQKEK